jgi:predicted Rdx family selenoprotein
VAAQIKKDLGVATELIVGASGEFTVWVDGAKVAEKTGGAFPEPADVVARIRAHVPAT